jgi:hypothetical protein
MAILSKPSRSYAAVDHDPNGLSEAGSVPYAYKHELKTFRPRKHPLCLSFTITDWIALSETHLKRPGGLDGHHGSSFSPLPNAFMSSRQRKQQQEEGRRAEAEHMLDPDFRSTSNFSLDDSQAGPSRKSSRTAGGMLGGSVMRGTSSLSNFKGPGKKSQLSGVYVDAEGKMHDTEFDPFAAVAEMTRNKSRRRSAFGSERKRGSDSESTSSEDSVDKSGSRPLADAKRNEEALRQRRDSERKRFEDISGQAMKRRQSILSQRSGEERTTPSLKSTDEGAMSMLQHYHLDRLNNRARSSQGFIHQGSLHRSPLSPTFGHSPSSPLPTVADTDERPEKSTETTSMPPPAVPKSKVEIKPGGTKKVTGFDAPESPHPSSTIQTPRSASHLALSPARMSTSSRASRASTETAGERTKPAERPREEIFPETPAQTKKREERQRRQARLGYGGGASSSTRLMDSRAASSGARVLPEIEILDDDDPRVVIPTDGRSTRLQTKYT